MRLNLIDQIKSEKDLSSAIILTHNIDFIFLQLVVLPALKEANQPKLTIFVDALCAADTYEFQSHLIGGIGTNYRVVPVLMSPGFRFHPKAVMLSGPENAKLFIGSGNLTYGGWVENGEIWVELDALSNGTNPFAWFYMYLQELLKKIPFSESVSAEIQEAFDTHNHRWATDLSAPSGLIGVGSEVFPALLDQITNTIGNENPIHRITVCAPFFDKSADALKALSERFGNPPTRVFIQNGRSTLLSKAAETLPENIDLIPISFMRLNKDGGEKESFLHAKYFAFEQSASVSVFSGSANCSNAALTLGGRLGNAELMVMQSLTIDSFKENFLDDLTISDEVLRLADDNEGNENDDDKARILIIATRMEDGYLFVGYQVNADTKITKCLVDKNSMAFQENEKNEIIISCNWPARYVRLTGEKEGSEVVSNLSWVDHENQLRTTARGRWLAETIRKKSRDEYWGLGAWTEIMDAFSKHLNYVPIFSRPMSSRKSSDQDNPKLEYTEEDVFSSSYGLGTLSAGNKRTLKTSSVKSLKELLIKWFGSASIELDEPPQDPSAQNGAPIKVRNYENPDETGDLPEDPIKPDARPTQEEGSEFDRERANKFISQIVDRICSLDYLENRPLEMIAADLNLMAVILLTGRRENWLSRDDFISTTKRIWTRLFLSAEPDHRKGWIEYRITTSGHPEQSLGQMRSLELSSILAAWSLSMPLDFRTAERTSFNLCCIMSVARLPELWIGGSSNQIAEKLEAELFPIVSTETFDPENPELFEKKWKMVMRLGHSIRALERSLGDAQPSVLKGQVVWSKIPAGTLLWQGINGFYVTLEPVIRTQHKMANVITLDGSQNFSKIQPDFLIPMETLISNNCAICKAKLADNHRKYLKALTYSISKGVKLSGKKWFETATA